MYVADRQRSNRCSPPVQCSICVCVSVSTSYSCAASVPLSLSLLPCLCLCPCLCLHLYLILRMWPISSHRIDVHLLYSKLRADYSREGRLYAFASQTDFRVGCVERFAVGKDQIDVSVDVRGPAHTHARARKHTGRDTEQTGNHASARSRCTMSPGDNRRGSTEQHIFFSLRVALSLCLALSVKF